MYLELAPESPAHTIILSDADLLIPPAVDPSRIMTLALPRRWIAERTKLCHTD